MITKSNRIHIERKIFNTAYLPLLDSDKRFKIVYGGSGSGKSHFIAAMLLIKVLSVKGANVLCVRSVDRTLRISVFALFKRIISEWGLESIFDYRETDMVITCKTGNQIICKGMNDRENIKSITFKNGNLTDVWIEEASELEYEDFSQLNLRLRGEDGVPKQIILSFNPVSSESWLKKTFFDIVRDDVFILKTTYKDNKYIDNEYRKQLEKLKYEDPLYWDVYCNGNWGVINNSNTIIPLTYLVKAKASDNAKAFDEVVFGIDVARFGSDSSVIYYRYGYRVFEPIEIRGQDLVSLSNIIKDKIVELKLHYPSAKFYLNIDETGVGAGLVDILNSNASNLGIEVIGVNFSQRPNEPQTYANVVSEMMFNVRNILRDEDVIIPDHEQTVAELNGRNYRIDSKSKIRAESKEEYKKRIGKSPDFADAFILMFKQIKEVVFL